MIFTKIRDPRFITIRRGGTLTDADHHLLALWATHCAEHVLHLFEKERPNDDRPRHAIEMTRAWVRGEIPMKEAHKTAFIVNAAAKEVSVVSNAAKEAALAAGQAVAVAHVAAHELGTAAYAIKAVRASVAENERDQAGLLECGWQRKQLPDAIRELVIDDQKLRNHVCWFVFNC